MYILDTDASHEATGAVLSQVQDGEEKVIAYASHALSKHELQYCVTRKELLAVYRYVQHFQHYLMGAKFRIRTDHRALTWLLSWQKPNTSQYCSWIAELENFNFDIEYRKGGQHINADALSRFPQCQQCDLRHEDPKKKRNIKLLSRPNTCYHTRLEHDFQDPVDSIIAYFRANHGLETLERNQLPMDREAAFLWKVRKHLKLRNREELIMQRDNVLLSIPRRCNRRGIVKQIHSKFGHLGIQGTKTIIKDTYFWQGMDFDIASVIAECTLCQRYKHKQKLRAGSRGNLQASFPFEKVAIDIAGPFKATRKGYRYLLALIDHFSKFPVLIPMKIVDSESIAQAIFSKWISLFGTPDSFHSDRGSNLNSELVMKLCRNLGIRKTKTTPYYPQGDGIVERLFRTVKPMLAIVSEERGLDWSQVIPVVEMGLRNRRNATTGFSPNEIIFGRNIYNHEFIENRQKDETGRTDNSVPDYVDLLVKHNHEIYRKIMNNANSPINEVKGNTYTFQDGDSVWVRKIDAKSGNVLFDGPFHIIKTIGKNAFRLKDNGGRIIDRNGIYLKRCIRDTKEYEFDGRDTCDTSIQSATTVTSEQRAMTNIQDPAFRDSGNGRRYPLRMRMAPTRYGFS